MLQRSRVNPILTRADIPDVSRDVSDVTSVFNPGAVWWNGRYILMLRVQTRGRETVLMVAEGENGEQFEVRPELVKFNGLDDVGETVYHVYDARLTRIGDTVYIVLAADVDGACRLGIAKTSDFQRFDLVSFDSTNDSRNGVLFPEKINGRYVRLERPNQKLLEGGVTSGDSMVLAESDDLITWTTVAPVMSGRQHYWDELVGSGPPPIKTRDGWLHIYHGVARHFAAGIYQAGVVLLDLDDPSKVIARGRNNILEPREMFEMVGQVPNVVFPSGVVVNEFDAEGFALSNAMAHVYYGAADTVVGLASAKVSDLIAACDEV